MVRISTVLGVLRVLGCAKGLGARGRDCNATLYNARARDETNPPLGVTPMPLIEEGQKAPAFSLKDQAGEAHRLSDYAGRSLVLYFYPKDDTSGCTKEACAFRDNLPRFDSRKAAILGVSILDEASKARFAAKHDLNFPLLADANHEVADKYGVWKKKSLYGRSFMGIARTTYLIDARGRVTKRWDNVKVDGHAEEVLASLESVMSRKSD
jgi:peroxiredoxin Q/BCP